MAKAKKITPSNLVRAVRPEGKKNVQWFAKTDNGFARVKHSEALTTLRGAGLKVAETLAAMADMKAAPFSAVRETKKGLTFVR